MKTQKYIFILSLLIAVTCTGCTEDIIEPEPPIPYDPAYKVTGLSFSPYNDGQNPNINSQISEQQISDLLNKAALYTNWVRTFGCTDGLEKIPGIAHSLGLKAAAGAWLSRDLSANQIQISKLIELGLAGHIDIAVVGSETILRGDLTSSQLIGYINQVKTALPKIPVTTADVYQTFLAHPEIINAVDIIMAHIYPYWEGISIDCAPYFINNKFESLLAVSQGKEIIIGETGWPSAGNSIGIAIPSNNNASRYFLNFVSWAKAKNVKYMYFETYDEQWKAAAEGPQGAHWGIFYKNGGDLKPDMKKVFDGETVPDNWTIDTTVIFADSPSVAFTYVLPLGSNSNLKGKAKGVFPSQYILAIYIYVPGAGWWNKPTFASPMTYLDCSNKFECDITTGINDPGATKIRAYLLTVNYNIPLIHGGNLPSSLEQDASAWIEVVR